MFYQIIKINKTQILLKYFFGARGVNFLKNDGKMFKYYKRLDDVLMFKYRLIHGHFQIGLVIFPRPHIGPKDDNQANMEMPMY